jgi:hypothetical protein
MLHSKTHEAVDIDAADDDITLYDIAREMADQYSTNETLVEAMVYRIENDADLAVALYDKIVRSACREAVRSVQGHDRKDARASLEVVQPDQGEQGEALRRTLGDIMAFRINNGLALAEATKDDCLTAAERYAGQGNTLLHNSRWLMLIAKKLPKDKRVKDVFDDDQLRDLWKKAKE